jgi:uncharacterized protein with PQ loop repeat
MFGATHHQHLRKRIIKNNESYPSPNRLVHFVDSLIYIAGIIGPLVSIPQLMDIWIDKNAGGISVFTWIGYCVLTFIWLVYGYVHHEKPIIITQYIWLFINIAVTIGAILYG